MPPTTVAILGSLVVAGCPALLGRQDGPTPALESFGLASPPPGRGIQLHAGPFEVPAGQEEQRIAYRTLPVDQAVDVIRIEIATRPGAHHCHLFRGPGADGGDREEVGGASDLHETLDLFAGTEGERLDWRLPASVGIRMGARERIALRTHYVGTDPSGRPTPGEVLVNLWFAEPGQTTHRMGALYASKAVQDEHQEPEHASGSTHAMWFTFDHDVYLAAVTGHFQGEGRRFHVSRWDGHQAGDALYETHDWEEPPFMLFGDAGVPVASGQGVNFTTEYGQAQASRSHTHVAQTSRGPHDNMFLFFYPADPRRDVLRIDQSGHETHVGEH